MVKEMSGFFVMPIFQFFTSIPVLSYIQKTGTLYQKIYIVSILIKFSIKCLQYFLLTKNHHCQQQIMANPTSSYINKLKDGAVNQVVDELWSGM